MSLVVDCEAICLMYMIYIGLLPIISIVRARGRVGMNIACRCQLSILCLCVHAEYSYRGLGSTVKLPTDTSTLAYGSRDVCIGSSAGTRPNPALKRWF